MNNELLANLEYIEKEKGIDKATLIEALRVALLSACKKTFRNYEEFEVVIDPATYQIKVLERGQEVRHADFGRIAAQTAKQVIIQKIREAERDTLFEDFSKKEGEIITGTVHTVDRKTIIVDLGKVEGILPAREQFPDDHYKQGDTIRAYVVQVKKTSKGPEIILSRTHPNLVRKLFELEVPEIGEGIVQIRDLAREPGSRSKIAVSSNNERIDSVGSCVGVRGQRVKNIVNELSGEKIDIIRWSENQEGFIREALKPAELTRVTLYEKEHRAEILVNDDQLSLAIGKKGQNVRLASKLTGWKLEIQGLTQQKPISALEGLGKKTEEALRSAGYNILKDFEKIAAEDLVKIPGIGPKIAEKILGARTKLKPEQKREDKEAGADHESA